MSEFPEVSEFLGITDESIANEAERIGREVDPNDPATAFKQLSRLVAHYILLRPEEECSERGNVFDDML